MSEITQSTYRYRVSIVTPTYNRADKIHRVFESLLAQTYRNFEWIVIDDGSTDITESVIEGFRGQSPFFPIIYHKKPNTGVVNSLGAAVLFIRGDFVIKCDSDDSYMPVMIETFLEAWEAIPDAERAQFRAISAPVVDQNHQFFGKPLGRPFLDTTNLDLEHRWHQRTERQWMERADLWSRFDFSEGIADHLMWYPLIRQYKIRCIDTPLRIYYRGEEGGLTTQKTRRSARMRFSAAMTTLNHEMDYFWWDPLVICWRATNVWFYGYALGYNAAKIGVQVTSRAGKALLWLVFPVGLWRTWRARRGGMTWR